MNLKILSRVKKIPGGLMVVPLLIGAAFNTFCPALLEIGSFTTAVFSSKGSAALVGVFLMFVGSQLKFKEAPEALKRGAVLVIAKFLIGAGFALLVAKRFGMEGIFGISVLALVSAMTSGNGGLYAALVSEYGDPIDIGALSVLNIKDGPFLTLLALGASGMADIPVISLLGAIGPLIVGIILGNLDDDIRILFKPGIDIMIPCFAFALGAGINFTNVMKAGYSGVLLGILVMAIGGIPLILVDKSINRRPGYAAAAVSSAAGNAVATPAAVALLDKTMQPYVAVATAQIAAAVVVTAICVPMLTSYVAKKSK